MAEMTFNINFDGYWREKNSEGIPARSGIYCVYECSYESSENVVSICRLIYIGDADNVWHRIENHEKKALWKRYVGAGNELCFSFGRREPEYRARIEAAFIFKHKPPANEEYKDTFPFDTTTILSTGRTARLNPNFTVQPTPQEALILNKSQRRIV